MVNVAKSVSIPLETMTEIDRIAAVEKKKFPETLGILLELGIKDYKKKTGEVKVG